MIAQKIKQLYIALGRKGLEYRSGWWSTNCPLAPWTHEHGLDEHPSFAVKESKGLSICKCFSCGFGGELMELLYRMKSLQKNDPKGLDLTVASNLIVKELEECELDFTEIPDYEEGVKVDHGFSEEWLATFGRVQLFPEAMKYLEKRKVAVQVIAKMDVRYDPIQRRIGFPFRNAAGVVMGVQGRAIDDWVALRYYQYGCNGRRNSNVWLGESWMDLDEPIVMVEGPFDAAKIMEVYPNVVASFTSGLSVSKLKRILDAQEIITFYDYGKGGEAARAKIKKVMKGKTIIDLIPTEEEDDPANMKLERIKDLLGEYVYLEDV